MSETTRPVTTAHRVTSTSSATSSYQFHAGLERPGAFLRREWRTLALCGGGFAAVMLAILLSIDAAFFYPRIETDQLLYLLKAKALVETGSTAAIASVNAQPFRYAAMPGILRAPFFLMFDDFDAQLRGIQIMNVAIVTLTATMSAYILSWALPQRAHPLAIAFAFGFTILSHDWLANIFVPLADAPYAALTQACLIIAAMTVTSRKPLSSNPSAIAAFVLLLIVAFFVRYTAPVLLVFLALLSWQRWRVKPPPKWVVAACVMAPIAGVAALVAIDSDAILRRYIGEPYFFIKASREVDIALHFFASALPAQVVPVFNLGYKVQPLSHHFVPVFGSTPRDVMWSLVGLGISTVTVRGMLMSRERFLPEIAYLLAPLPVLALMMPSTTRYLMSYQPLIWICFFIGLASMTAGLRSRASALQLRLLAATVAIVAIAGMAFLRSSQTARTAGGGGIARSLEEGLAYVHDVERIFRSLRSFLETLPADRALLIGSGGNTGRYTVIANRRYYRPDRGLSRATETKDVYAVVTCSTAATCRGFDQLVANQTKTIQRFGTFGFTPVFDNRTLNARALVRRVVPLS